MREFSSGRRARGLLERPELEELQISAIESELARKFALDGQKLPRSKRSVLSYVATTVCATPEAIAISDDSGHISYAELFLQAVALGDRLRVAEGEVVALIGPRSRACIIAFLAFEHANVIYLPMDSNWPLLRKREVLNASNAAAIVITDPDFTDEFITESSLPVYVVGSEPDMTCEASSHACRELPDDELRYVIYTSGSTGKPKGALIEQRGMVNHLLAKVENLNLTSSDCVAFSAPLTFDVSIWQMLSALLVGARVHVVSEDDSYLPERLVASVGTNGISILEVVPTILRLILDYQEANGALALRTLRVLLSTGEALPPSLASRWSLAFPAVPLLNAYGPTECSDDVTHYRVSTIEDGASQIPIGFPIANTSLYVLAETATGFVACKPGDVGELFVGGAGVGPGYLQDVDRTRAVFFKDPFEKTARIYRTGDRVRVNIAGSLEHLGRVDRQVKVGGVRIELAEIEEVILRHRGVSECVVVATTDVEGTLGRKRLVAFISGESLKPGDVRAHLVDRLPMAMVPARVVVIDAMPLTANGKTDYRTLTDWAAGSDGRDNAVPTVANSTHRDLSALVSLIQRRDNLAANDASILCALPVDTLMESTIAALASGATVIVRDDLDSDPKAPSQARTVLTIPASLFGQRGYAGLERCGEADQLNTVDPQGKGALAMRPQALAGRGARVTRTIESPSDPNFTLVADWDSELRKWLVASQSMLQVSAYVLDPCGDLAPIGAPGVIYRVRSERSENSENDAEVSTLSENEIAGGEGIGGRRLFSTGMRAFYGADANIYLLDVD